MSLLLLLLLVMQRSCEQAGVLSIGASVLLWKGGGRFACSLPSEHGYSSKCENRYDIIQYQ